MREIPEIRPRWPPASRGLSHLANAAAVRGESPVQSVLFVAENIMVDSYAHLARQDAVEANMAFAIVAMSRLPSEFRPTETMQAYTSLLGHLEHLTVSRLSRDNQRRWPVGV